MISQKPPHAAFRAKRQRQDKARAERGRLPPGSIERKAEARRNLAELNIHVPKYNLATPKMVRTVRELKEAIRSTWHEKYDGYAKMWMRFSEKQIAFARFYAKNGRRNKTGAMRQAGYDTTDNDQLWQMGTENLRRPGMEELVQAFEFEEKARMKLNVEDVVEWFNKIATAAMETGDFTNANRAMENLAKYLGMFVEKKEITHKVVSSKEELDARIDELKKVLADAREEIDAKLNVA